MEALAQLLQQAQTAVLSVQADVATMQTQMDEFGDQAIVNPCVADLQVTIQQKQVAAAELLKRSAGLFYESMGELEEKARALGNVKSRERELEKTKKAMHRYFEAQKKTQDELKSEYDGVISVQEDKLAHVTEAAAELLRANAARRVRHHALTLWLKKAMIRAFWRLHQQQEEARELQHASFTQEHDALAEEAHLSKRQQILRQKLFHAWERRTHHRTSARLREEAAQLEKEAEFFRKECANTQRVLSGHLQSEYAKMQLTSHAQAKECELLDDEVGRLKTALVEITGEFSERTQTYVRQQQETELFFRRKEQKLRDALVETQTELEKLRAYAKRFHNDLHTLESSVTAHVADAQMVFWEATSRKEALFTDTVHTMFGRLAQRHKAAMGEVAELKDNVHLLAPLSEKVLRLESTLAASTDLVTSNKKATREAQQRVDKLLSVSSLLTDQLERANHHKLRSFYFMCWSTHAVARHRRSLESENADLRETLRMKQRDFLIQQQGAASSHKEERDRLLAEIEDQKTVIRNQRKELDEAKDQRERNEGQLDEAQMDINKLKAQLSRAEQEKHTTLQKLCAARLENLKLDEDNARFSIEYKEVKWRGGLHQQHVSAWRAHAEALADSSAQLAVVCEQWGRHCETAEAAHKGALAEQRQRTVRALSTACENALARGVFSHWRTWAPLRRQLRDTRSEHEAHVATLRHQHEAITETARAQELRWKADLAAQQQERQRATASLTASHAVASAKQAEQHDAEVRRLQVTHSEAVAELSRQHEQTCGALKGELSQLQRRLNEVGDLVVFYCAQAAFTKWRTFAATRRAARQSDDQLRSYRRAGQLWMTSRAELITQRYQRGEELLLAAVEGLHERQAAAQANEYSDLLQRHRQLSALFEEVTSAGEMMEQQLSSAKTKVRRLTLQLASEKEYTAAVQSRLSSFSQQQETERLLFHRILRHQQHLAAVADEHLRCLLSAFEEAGQETSSAFVAEQQRRREAAEEAERAAHTTTQPEVSSIASEHDNGDVDDTSLRRWPDGTEVAPAEADTAPARETNDDIETVATLSVLMPEELHERLRSLEEASKSFAASQQRDASSLESIKDALHVPFTAAEPSVAVVDAAAAAAPARGRLPARRVAQAVPSVEAALEVVRRSALCLVEGERQGQKSAEEESRKRLEGVEETLQDVRHSMETMLEEQRRMAAEMKAELSQSRSVLVSQPSAVVEPQPSTVPNHAETQMSAFLMDAWSERLEMLTSRYQRVLDAFSRDLDDRRATFYSVNGMLVATEMFSEELLSRFEANMEEMKCIKAQIAASTPPPPAATQPDTDGSTTQGHRSMGTSPVDPDGFRREQEQQEALLQLQKKLAAVAGDYETTLQRFLHSVTEEQCAFQTSARVLREADAFSERLVGRLRQNLADVELAKAHAASAEVPGRSLADDFHGASQESGAPAAPLEQPLAQQRDVSPSVSPSSSGARSPAVSASLKRESPEKVILRDRVELLEKLLVQAKVQLAETRQLLANSGGVPPPLQPTNAYVAVGERSSGAGEAEAIAETVERLRERERETQKAHEEQLLRVRADTEQLVAMRYREEIQRCEARVGGLLDKIDENNRFYEAEKAKLERRLQAAEAEAAENDEAHARTMEQMRRSFQREIEELSQENALMQEELQERERRTVKAIAQAREQQKELLTLDHEAKMKKLAADVKQLSHERDSLREQAAATERDLNAMLAEERRTLEEATARYEEELRTVQAKYEALLEEAMQRAELGGAGDADEYDALSTGVLMHLDSLHHRFESLMERKTAYVLEAFEEQLAEFADRAASALESCASQMPAAVGDSSTIPKWDAFLSCADALSSAYLQSKCDYLLDSSLAAVEAYYTALLTQALSKLECDKDELETENMHLSEQVALLKAESEERSAEHTEAGEVNDITGGGQSGASPSLPRAPPSRGPPSPDVVGPPQPPLTSSRSGSTGGPPRGTTSSADSFDNDSPSPVAAPAGSATPARDSADCSCVTPTRSSLRSRSLDSLELSQQLLRYSRKLHEQEERNAERLNRADVLTAHVEDLIARGERLRAFAEREHLTPRKRK